jgi:hypothetical protein
MTESIVRWFIMKEKHCWMTADSADKLKRTRWQQLQPHAGQAQQHAGLAQQLQPHAGLARQLRPHAGQAQQAGLAQMCSKE